jgi:hypothetical protein
MFSSQNTPISCRNLFEQSFSSTSSLSFASFTSISSSTQTIPTFSTPSKHPPHSNSRNSIPLMRLLHTSLDTPGVGCQPKAKPLFRSSLRFRVNSPQTASPTPFPATLAASLQPTVIPATLSSFAATLTCHVNANSFVCHSCKKHPGGGVPITFSRYLSASLLHFFQFSRHLSNYSLHSVRELSSPSLFASALLALPSLWCRLPGAQNLLSQRFS